MSEHHPFMISREEVVAGLTPAMWVSEAVAAVFFGLFIAGMVLLCVGLS